MMRLGVASGLQVNVDFINVQVDADCFTATSLMLNDSAIPG